MSISSGLTALQFLFFIALVSLLVSIGLFYKQKIRLAKNLSSSSHPSSFSKTIKTNAPSETETPLKEDYDIPGDSFFLETDEPINLLSFFKALVQNIQKDQVPDLGAQSTYYLLLAIFPFFIVLLSILQYTPLESQMIINQLANIIPEAAHDIIFGTISEVFDEGSGALLSFGLIAALWSSLKGASALIKGVNIAYNVAETRHFIVVKIIALITTLGVPLVILLSFFFIIFGELIGTYVFDFFGLSQYFVELWNLIRYPLPLGVMIIFFSFFYKFAPNKSLRFRDVFWGSLFTVVFWLLSSLGFSFYVNNFSNYSAVYGSLGSIIIVLLWLYISSIIVIVGGEVNVVLHRYREIKRKKRTFS